MGKFQKIKICDLFTPVNIIDQDIDFIFYHLANDNTGGVLDYPLVQDFINSSNYYMLDNEYMLGYSYEKYLSPYFVQLLDYERTTYPNKTLFEHIGLMMHYLIPTIYNHFGVKWKKIYDALIGSVYNPLHNYDVEEKRTPNITHTETFNSVQDQRTPNLTTTGSANAKTGVFGFNGTTAKDSGVNDGTSSESVTGTDTNVKTGNITNAETGTDTLTRKGNIGVTSSQQLIESELELRKHDFYRIIYNDIDSILCLKIY